VLDWLRRVNAAMERELLGGVETNRTELLPGSTAGSGPRERHERCGAELKDVNPPLTGLEKKSTV